MPSTKTNTATNIPTRLRVRPRHLNIIINNNNISCNKFLSGGSHYPGKDKKRTNYRNCVSCSSLVVRMVIGFLILLIAFGIRPIFVRFSSRADITAENIIVGPTILPPVGEDYHDDNDGDDTVDDIQTQNDELSNISDKGEEIEEEKGIEDEETDHILLRTLHNTEIHAIDCNCPANIPADSITTTLVLQTTVDRLPFLFETCSRWRTNPIIVVVYITPSNIYDDADILDEGGEGDYWEDNEKTFQKACPNAKFIPHMGQSRTEHTMKYPINKLRNLGLDEVHTSHVLVLDVDFIPSDDLDGRIDEAIITRLKQEVLQHGGGGGAYGATGVVQKDAIVIPAFERTILGGKPCMSMEDCLKNLDIQDAEFEFNDDDVEKIIINRYIPGTMDELRDCYALSDTTTNTNTNGGCAIFQKDVNWDGHSSTRAEEWLQTRKTLDTSSVMRRVPCFDSNRYEPYVVLPWCPASLMNLRQSPQLLTHTNAQQQPQRIQPISPYYDERFYGYGKNKIQQIAHLRVKGYNFSVLPPEGFIMHMPHPVSAAKVIWNNSGDYDLHEKMDTLYPKYLKELQERYMDSNSNISSTTVARTRICQKRPIVGGENKRIRGRRKQYT